MDHTREVADKVAAAVLRSGKSKSAVADQAGIPRTTFSRLLNGHAEFSVGQLLRVAEATGAQPSTLLPSRFLAVA